MSAPQRLSRQLERTLGAEAARDLVHLLDGRVKSDLLRWSFLFWCAAVGSIAGLAGILR